MNQSAPQDSISVIAPQPKKTFFNPKKILLLLLAVSLIITASALGWRFLSKQKPATLQQSDNVHSKAVITTIHIPEKGPAIFVKTESISTDPQIIITQKPKTLKNSYIFQAELISKDQQSLYKSWKQSPIIRTTDGGFDIKVLTPYQPGSILKISSEENKSIILTGLK